MANPFDALDDPNTDTLAPGPEPTLYDRFRLNFEAGQRYNTVLGAVHDVETETNRQAREKFDRKFEAFPEWQGFLEGSTALAGQIAGTAASPENFVPIGVGEKILLGTKIGLSALWARVFSGAVDAATVNGLADASIQGIENAGDLRDGFDVERWAESTLLGAAIGGAAGGVGHAVASRGSGKAAPAARDNPFDALDEAAPLPEKLEPAVTPKPADATPSAPPPLPETPEAVPITPDNTIGEKLAGDAASVRTPQEKRILRKETPTGKPPAKPKSLSRFLAEEGGISDGGGELKNFDADKASVPGAGKLVKDGGRSLDYAREAAAEAGYFDHLYGDPETAVAKSTIDDLLSALDQDLRGTPVYSGLDTAEVSNRAAFEDAKAARQALAGKLEQLRPHIEGGDVPDDIVMRAAQHMGDGAEASDALERAIMEDYRANGEPIPLEREDGTEIPFYEAKPLDRPDERGGGQGERGTDARGKKPGDGGAARDAGPDGRAARPSGDRAGGEANDIGEFLAMAQYALPSQARARPAAGIAAKASANIARVRETAEALAKQLGVAATRQQRMAQRKSVRGIYKVASGVVRVRSLDDFDVLTHEYGHHVEKRIPAMTKIRKSHRKVLGILDYDPKRGSAEEGFAEFFRLWITNRAYARKALGKVGQPFVADFEKALAANPEISAAIDAAEQAWSDFLAAPSSAAVASTIVSRRAKGNLGAAREAIKKNGIGDTIHDVLQRAYGFLFDDLNPINRAVKALKDIHFENTGKALDLDVSSDAYRLARMSRGAYSAGHMDVMYGVAPYRELKPASASLRDAIVEATGKPNALGRWDDALLRDFGGYLWSRRALGEWERFDHGVIPNPPDKLTRGDHAVNVSEMEARYPQFAGAAAKVHEFALALWQKKRDSGLISSTVYEEGLAIRDYVPGLRDFSNETDFKVPGGFNRQGKTAKGGFSRRFRGSTRDVINPLESLMNDAYETAMAIARNDVVKAIDRLARTAGPGGGAIAEAIPTKELSGTMVDPLEAVENAARAAGLAKPDIVAIRDALESAIGDQKAAIFRPAVISERGEAIAFFRDGGDLRALRLADGRFGKDLYGALTAMTQHEKNFWLELVAMPARLLRLGITTSLDFLGANFVRDQTMATIFYGRPLRRIASSLRGAADDVIGTDAAKIYARAAGLSGGSETASLGIAFARRDLQALRRKGWTAQRLTSFRGILQTTELAETATRLGLFRTFMDEARKRGLSDMEAALEASWRARDYIDFDRRGSGMAAIARIVPFLNVAMQGIDKSVRHMIAPLARKVLGQPLSAEDGRAMGEAVKAWARLGAVVTGAVSLYALMSRNEDHDEISVETRSTHFMIKNGGKWIAVPKPFELGAFINLGEAVYDATVRKDPSAAGRWLDSLYYSLMPPNLVESNPAIKSYFEIKTNKDFFTGGPIVPEALQGMEPFLQYTSRTSALARQIGRAFDISPAIADHLIANHLGSWGRNLLSLYDMAQPDAPGFAWDDAPISRRFIKDASRGAQSTSMFWRLASEQTGTLEGKAKSWRTLADSGDAAGAAEFYASLDDEAKAYVAVSTMEAKARRLQPLVRARLAVQAIGTVRRELAAGQLRDQFGERFAVGSAARTAADDILSALSMAVTRNGLIVEGVPGWAQRAEIPEDGFYRELQAVSPELAQRLADAFTTSKVWRFDAVEAAWPELRRRALADGTAAETLDLVADVEASGNPISGGMRRKRRARPELDLSGG